MKRLYTVIAVFAALSIPLFEAPYVEGAETVSANITASVQTSFTIQFYTPDSAHVVYSNFVPFTKIDPTQTYALPDTRKPGDGKSDVGVYCISSSVSPWFLKLGISGGNIPGNKLKYYLSQPYMWNGTTSLETDGEIIPDPAAWTPIQYGTGSVIYKSGLIDTVNTPYGTLATLSFQLDPSGLLSTMTYTATLTYTMTTTP